MNTTTYENFPLTFDRIQPGMLLEITRLGLNILYERCDSLTLRELAAIRSGIGEDIERVVHHPGPLVAVCVETHGPVGFTCFVKVVTPEHGIGVIIAPSHFIAEYVRELKETTLP